MRLLSALLAAGTVLAVFLFLRELLPSTPWAWTVGALMVAFQPMFDFIAAGVQGDNLLFFASTLTFLMLTRAYRRGLTTKRGRRDRRRGRDRAAQQADVHRARARASRSR